MRSATLAIILATLAIPDPITAQDHTAFSTLLAGYVTPSPDGLNRVDYDRWRSNPDDRKALDAYISGLEATAVSTLPRDERFAFWANLYNAVTVRLILDENPSRSIRQIRPHPFAFGPWGAKRVTVEGKRLSLDNIEHDILRATFNDPRVHYALNCASIGCPDLGTRAWEAATLEEDLNSGARAYVNHPRGVTVTKKGLRISKIYNWFREDFGDSTDGVIEHLLPYANDELKAAIRANPRIDGHQYNWDLNRVER